MIELGPGAGDKGGKIVFTGTPEKMIRSKGTVTGSFLKPLLQF